MDKIWIATHGGISDEFPIFDGHPDAFGGWPDRTSDGVPTW